MWNQKKFRSGSLAETKEQLLNQRTVIEQLLTREDAGLQVLVALLKKMEGMEPAVKLG